MPSSMGERVQLLLALRGKARAASRCALVWNTGCEMLTSTVWGTPANES